METKTIKQKILSGEMTDKDLEDLLAAGQTNFYKKGNGFLNNLLKYFVNGYTVPAIWKFTIGAIFILVVITGLMFLTYTGHIDKMVTSVLLAFVIGFFFGKVK